MNVTYKSQEEKLVFQSNEYLELGQSKGYFMLDGKKIKLVFYFSRTVINY